MCCWAYSDDGGLASVGGGEDEAGGSDEISG